MATQMEVFASMPPKRDGRFESVDVAMISFVHEAELCYSSVKLAGFGGVSLKALRWALECACRTTLVDAAARLRHWFPRKNLRRH